MSFNEYCKSELLDITLLSRKSIQILAGAYLAGIDPEQEGIDMMARVDSGELTPQEACDIEVAKIMAED